MLILLLLGDYPKDESILLVESYGSLKKDFSLKSKKCRAEMMRSSKWAWERGSGHEKPTQTSGLGSQASGEPKSSKNGFLQKCAFLGWGWVAVFLLH